MKFKSRVLSRALIIGHGLLIYLLTHTTRGQIVLNVSTPTLTSKWTATARILLQRAGTQIVDQSGAPENTSWEFSSLVSTKWSRSGSTPCLLCSSRRNHTYVYRYLWSNNEDKIVNLWGIDTRLLATATRFRPQSCRNPRQASSDLFWRDYPPHAANPTLAYPNTRRMGDILWWGHRLLFQSWSN